MLCFNMFPQSRPVTSCPQTILTLPQVSKLAHLWCDCSIKFGINWAKWEYDMVSSLFGEWFHMPLWYLLLWWCQAFLEGQNFEQIGQVYPWLDTCLDSMCSQSRVLYLVVHRQSPHCHRSLALHIFADIWASRSAQKRKIREEGTLSYISSITTVELALMLLPCILWRAKLGAKGTWVACWLDMLGLDVFPEASLVLCLPEAVFALPKVTQLDHSLRYCSL